MFCDCETFFSFSPSPLSRDSALSSDYPDLSEIDLLKESKIHPE
jgi:hypothetical protein